MLGLLPWEVEALLATLECEEEMDMDIGEQPTLLLPVAPVAQQRIERIERRTRVLPIVRFQRTVEAIRERSRQFIVPYQLWLEKELVR